jgi:hypothetical protein
MRSNIINSSIANVITRFVKATSMLRAVNAPQQQRHLTPCAGPLSGWHPGTDFLFRDMSPVTAGMHGTYLPTSERSLELPGTMVSIRQLFLRLS